MEELDDVEAAIKLRDTFDKKTDLVALYQAFAPENITKLIQLVPTEYETDVAKWVEMQLAPQLETLGKLNHNLQALVVNCANALYYQLEILSIGWERNSEGDYFPSDKASLSYGAINCIINNQLVNFKGINETLNPHSITNTYKLSDRVLRLYNAQYWQVS